MVRLAALGLFAICACAEVPASVCFSDEPCAADASVRGGGSGGGLGGAGGGVNTGGGAQGGGTGAGDAGFDAGAWTRPVEVGNLGFAMNWPDTRVEIPGGPTAPPTFDRIAVPLTGATTNCAELFRGGVALPNGHVLGIPFCADRFLDVDPSDGGWSWVGPLIAAPMKLGIGDSAGRFAGGVLGCDGRAYALPYRLTSVGRVDPQSLTLTVLRLVDESGNPVVQGPELSGGVLVGTCDAFDVVAAGRNGFTLLEVFEEGVRGRPATSARSLNRRFVGAARIGDDFVASAPAPSGLGLNDDVSLLLDLRTSQVTELVLPVSVGAVRGLAVNRDETLSFVNSSGGYGFFALDAGWRLAGLSNSPDQLWVANSLQGWIYGSSQGSLVGWADGFTDADTLSDGGVSMRRSGGVVVTAEGHVVDLPGVSSGAPQILIYRTGDFGGGGPQALGPWFNKL